MAPLNEEEESVALSWLSQEVSGSRWLSRRNSKPHLWGSKRRRLFSRWEKKKIQGWFGFHRCPGCWRWLPRACAQPRGVSGETPRQAWSSCRQQSWLEGWPDTETEQMDGGKSAAELSRQTWERDTVTRQESKRAEDWMGRQPPRPHRSQKEGRCLFERICWHFGKGTLKQQRESEESTRFLHKTPPRHRNGHHGTLWRRWQHKGTGQKCVNEASPQAVLPRQRKMLAYSLVGGEPYFLEMVGKNCQTEWQTWAGLPMFKKKKKRQTKKRKATRRKQNMGWEEMKQDKAKAQEEAQAIKHTLQLWSENSHLGKMQSVYKTALGNYSASIFKKRQPQ